MKLTGQQLKDLVEGTAVRVIVDTDDVFHPGQRIYRKRDVHDCNQSSYFSDDDNNMAFMTPNEVELIAEESPAAVAACGTIARPILETRKIGKIAIELFDQGFVNAIKHVGEIMTWAGVEKGYKPHDWVNLPDAENAFQGAASRHRMEALIQKVNGVPASERVDDESHLLHLGHQAFNVLAELELVLRGRIQ
jgi:hypothetical protein